MQKILIKYMSEGRTCLLIIEAKNYKKMTANELWKLVNNSVVEEARRNFIVTDISLL